VPPFAHWHGIATRPGAAGAPFIEDALGWLECETRAEHEAGDHTFFVGEVLAVEQGRPAPPLVYLGGRYLSL
jgi:flavin reductase (DIM6/NTAB) family NADH-FMN oxidoreductase RutF